MDWYSLSIPLLCFNVVDRKKKKNIHVYTLTKTRNQFMEIPRRLESWCSRSSLTHVDKQHLNTTPQPRGKKNLVLKGCKGKKGVFSCSKGASWLINRARCERKTISFSVKEAHTENVGAYFSVTLSI